MSKGNVHYLPSLIHPDDLQHRTVVIIDVLRATTTIAYALAAGAQSIVPCLEVADARNLQSALGEGALLGGERDGVTIKGFDLGNSPSEYTSERVRDRDVVFTTTNGTKAMQHAQQGARVLLASFANLSAVAKLLHAADSIEIVCAGTDGHISREDVLLAGALITTWSSSNSDFRMNDQALLARDAWLQIGRRRLAHELRESRGGHRLIELGRDADIEIAAAVDVLTVVPGLDVKARRIVAI